MKAIDLADTYLHLDAGAGIEVLPVDEQFWATIDQRSDLDVGRLMMATPVTADWANREMHPDGDEVILVTDGAVRVHTDSGEPVVVRAPDLVLLPAGAWHTMDVIEPGRVVTITWGAGTQHRAR
jgi:mannose-6-phosphate isomerase-like protein (cupin superfamily)